jgi:hypothetical protein
MRVFSPQAVRRSDFAAGFTIFQGAKISMMAGFLRKRLLVVDEAGEGC